MSEKRILVTVNLKEAAEELSAVLNQLKRDGLEIDRVDEVLGIANILGTYAGDIAHLNKKGVWAEFSQWSQTQ